MKKIVSLTILVAFLFVLGCSTHIHTIGNGPQKNEIQTARQWYVLWGIVPLNNVDSSQMAGNAKDYEIKTEQTLIDGIITMFTNAVTVSCRSVIVTK